jgi:hypothetical protein
MAPRKPVVLLSAANTTRVRHEPPWPVRAVDLIVAQPLLTEFDAIERVGRG